MKTAMITLLIVGVMLTGCVNANIGGKACTADAKICPDGSSVGRNPDRNCEFNPCPEPKCNGDVKECPDGDYVYRNPDKNCEFDSCSGIFG